MGRLTYKNKILSEERAMSLDELILPKVVEATFYKLICPNCGWHNFIKDLARFCPKSGKDLSCGHLKEI